MSVNQEPTRQQDSERAAILRWKETYKGDPGLNSTNKKSCLQEADRLKRENGGGGVVYYVCELDGKRVYHAYYLPNPNRTSQYALNHAENGFEGYPLLTVGEVLDLGFPVPENVSTSKLIRLIQENW